MNLEKVIFGFFVILALCLNLSFFIGEIDDPAHHDVIEFFLVVVVNIIATGLKLGDRSQIGALLLATSLVADLLLIAAAIIWAYAVHVSDAGMVASTTASIVSLAGGALVANIVSVAIVVGETLMLRR
jgi:hypothetical protein